MYNALQVDVRILGTSPMTYHNLSPGDHAISIKAQAIKLGQPLEAAIAERNFTIVNPGKNVYIEYQVEASLKKPLSK